MHDAVTKNLIALMWSLGLGWAVTDSCYRKPRHASGGVTDHHRVAGALATPPPLHAQDERRVEAWRLHGLYVRHRRGHCGASSGAAGFCSLSELEFSDACGIFLPSAPLVIREGTRHACRNLSRAFLHFENASNDMSIFTCLTAFSSVAAVIANSLASPVGVQHQLQPARLSTARPMCTNSWLALVEFHQTRGTSSAPPLVAMAYRSQSTATPEFVWETAMQDCCTLFQTEDGMQRSEHAPSLDSVPIQIHKFLITFTPNGMATVASISPLDLLFNYLETTLLTDPAGLPTNIVSPPPAAFQGWLTDRASLAPNMALAGSSSRMYRAPSYPSCMFGKAYHPRQSRLMPGETNCNLRNTLCKLKVKQQIPLKQGTTPQCTWTAWETLRVSTPDPVSGTPDLSPKAGHELPLPEKRYIIE
ncbi:hypothetical protein DOTSEDRAFT_31863 [Dothistroma septosporum NZE10]|uniref:Uncharacterized protein n=1 Tax=Dothistroma septosporum (strain NZE10 / CBS 128990) TaxID=675120 RepID=N1PYE2_DOTSN|nr:hypothetical protein DOTSEDRAFT_31863 [Dothistroma septosporum NZE10]